MQGCDLNAVFSKWRPLTLFDLPVLVQAAIILCCLGCAIFGITEVPTDGVEFDTGDLTESGTAESSPMHDSTQAAPLGSPYEYVPPSTSSRPDSSGVDPELGQRGKNRPSPSSGRISAPSKSTQPVDLLDDFEKVPKPDRQESELHELD